MWLLLLGLGVIGAGAIAHSDRGDDHDRERQRLARIRDSLTFQLSSLRAEVAASGRPIGIAVLDWIVGATGSYVAVWHVAQTFDSLEDARRQQQVMLADAAANGAPIDTAIINNLAAAGSPHEVERGSLVSGDVGVDENTRTYEGITRRHIDQLLKLLREYGANLRGTNPWVVDLLVTSADAVTIRMTWNQSYGRLNVEVLTAPPDQFDWYSGVWAKTDELLERAGVTNLPPAAYPMRSPMQRVPMLAPRNALIDPPGTCAPTPDPIPESHPARRIPPGRYVRGNYRR